MARRINWQVVVLLVLAELYCRLTMEAGLTALLIVAFFLHLGAWIWLGWALWTLNLWLVWRIARWMELHGYRTLYVRLLPVGKRCIKDPVR